MSTKFLRYFRTHTRNPLHRHHLPLPIMSSRLLNDFEQRAIKAESMVKSLQSQLNSLQTQLASQPNNQAAQPAPPNRDDEKHAQPGMFEFQPDSTYPKWYTTVDPLHPAADDIMVLNSLCPDTKVPFVPRNGRLVKWYTCGPTVYAPSHMGHARTYITFDIIRNILEHYFGYRVNLVMNITDVDDKIILRARQNHLYAAYLKSQPSPKQLAADIDAAFKSALDKHQRKVAAAEADLASAQAKHRKDCAEMLAGEKVKLENVRRDFAQYQTLSDRDAQLKLAKGVLSEQLDAAQGSSVRDQSIFRAHAEKFEEEFLADMRALNVRDPDVLTRVTEYVPQIVSFVETLVAKGFGYEVAGSVYFDMERYLGQGHDYPKLDPFKLDSTALMAEAEGALADTKTRTQRKSSRDFALWKASKPGEPSWPSPWGGGRPGWHIECSAMASHVLGDNLDIHTGGEDLKFPHHDNEMAQSCAFYSEPSKGCAGCHKQWVNYWFHAGHLHIGGLKMSKSLKNFITIRQALEMCSARQIRLLFLLQCWHGQMNYADDQIDEARAKEHQLAEFFRAINALNRRYNAPKDLAATPYLATDKADLELNANVMARQMSVDAALRDNFDYVKATNALFDLMNDCNVYVKNRQSGTPNMLLLKKAASFINDQLKVFGVVSQNEATFLGAQHNAMENALQPVLDVIAEYRAALTSLFRNKAKWAEYAMVSKKFSKIVSEVRDHGGKCSGRESELVETLVQFDEEVRVMVEEKEDGSDGVVRLTDALRDEKLPRLGVKIEDLEGGNGSIWKLYEAEELMAMLARDGEAAEERRREKVRNRVKHLEKEVEQWRKKAVSPRDVLRGMEDKEGRKMYSEFDAEGMPKKDGQGKALSKKQVKKLAKLVKNQQKAYDKYLEKVKEDEGFLVELEKELEQAKSEL